MLDQEEGAQQVLPQCGDLRFWLDQILKDVENKSVPADQICLEFSECLKMCHMTEQSVLACQARWLREKLAQPCNADYGQLHHDLTKFVKTVDFTSRTKQSLPPFPTAVPEEVSEEVATLRRECRDLRSTLQQLTDAVCQLTAQTQRQHDGTLNDKHVQVHGCQIGKIDLYAGNDKHVQLHGCRIGKVDLYGGKLGEEVNVQGLVGISCPGMASNDSSSVASWVQVTDPSSSVSSTSGSGISVACFVADCFFRAALLFQSCFAKNVHKVLRPGEGSGCVEPKPDLPEDMVRAVPQAPNGDWMRGRALQRGSWIVAADGTFLEVVADPEEHEAVADLYTMFGFN